MSGEVWVQFTHKPMESIDSMDNQPSISCGFVETMQLFGSHDTLWKTAWNHLHRRGRRFESCSAHFWVLGRPFSMGASVRRVECEEDHRHLLAYPNFLRAAGRSYAGTVEYGWPAKYGRTASGVHTDADTPTHAYPPTDSRCPTIRSESRLIIRPC